MNSLRFYISLIIIALYSNATFAQTAKYATLVPYIEALMDENAVAGLSIAVVENQRIVWAQGFGYADREAKDRVTTSTLFQAGSVSKTPVAFLLMQLVEQGVYDLDAPINQYLKHWQIDHSDYPKNNVTIRQLLSHTAGVNTHGFNGYTLGDTRPTTLQILNGKFPSQSQSIHLTILVEAIAFYNNF
jgi:CubicO group peptidase (beta-lactamase class C family)